MKLMHDPLVAKNAPAVLGFLLAMLLGFRAVAAPEAECATTQPELRKLFPIEMRILKNFEGILSDISYRQGNRGLQARTYYFNANKRNIQLQVQVTNDIGDSVTSKAHVAKVCKTENGMVIKAGDLEIPFMVLSNKEVRMKLNQSWYPFYRIQDAHFNFLPEGEKKFGQMQVTPPAADTGATTDTATPPAADGTR